MTKNKPTPSAGLRHLTNQKLSANLFSETMKSVKNAPDRIIGICYPSLVESALKEEIIRCTQHLNTVDQAAIFAENGPMPTFYTKILIGRDLGIYGEEIRTELGKIKSVRNVFAHGLGDISFEDELIASVCHSLKTPALLQTDAPPFFFGPSRSRHYFVVTCQFLFSRFATAGSFDPPTEAWPQT